MSNLLLQQTTFKAKSKVNKETLVRRMQLWKEDKIEDLVDECSVNQSQLKTTTRKDDAHERAERFNKLTIQGNIKAAIRLLSVTERGGVLSLNEEAMTELKKKHPDAQPQLQQLLLHGPVKQVNPVIFDQIDGGTILQAASKTKGSSGPSMSNADDWWRILVSHQYGNATVDLRKAIATMPRKLCREDNKSSESIEALIASRLILLSKDPGVRPIGIGEVLRRIIGKGVTFTIKEDIIKSSGNLQLCGGQKSGAEIAVRALMELFRMMILTEFC